MSGSRILVVEDNLLNRRLLHVVLELRGHQVIEATSAAEGREQLQRQVPDLVLLDIGIPGGGEQLLRDIRADPRLAALPVVAVTAFVMPGDRERLLKSGFDGYLSKPIDVRTFGPEVEAFVRRSP
jgi:two-component system cell cycle response regulator DivK